ncbi:MAG: RidA family protein [Planctomycetota bacterium]
MSVDAQIEALGLELPPPPASAGVYKPVLVVDNLAYVSGHLPFETDGSLIRGRVGVELDEEQGYRAARQVGLTILSSLRSHFGSLDPVHQVVKLFGMVSCPPEFTKQPAIINGCSELFSSVWGDDLGVGTRSAVGVAALPLGIPVEIEGIFKLRG